MHFFLSAVYSGAIRPSILILTPVLLFLSNLYKRFSNKNTTSLLCLECKPLAALVDSVIFQMHKAIYAKEAITVSTERAKVHFNSKSGVTENADRRL